ncbi:MAG: hypothetical protein K8S54_06490 [Spirochaetia bacterium]|nr:hypothetical protein [Spirochaetia bacterium]
MKIQFKTESLDLKNYKLDVSLGIPEIGHHFPTGDLFRQVRIKSFDGIGNQILLHIIARDVDPNTFVTHSDTSLKVTDRQSIAGQFAFSTTTMPARCLVEFMFEGKIEHLHRHETPQKEQRIILYDGACH